MVESLRKKEYINQSLKSEIGSVSEEDNSDYHIFEKLKLSYHSDNAENEDDS
jgi:hypothetical protein